MKNTLMMAALAASVLLSGSASAKEWFDSCKITEKGSGSSKGTAFVGGTGNKAHLHVGTDFIDDTRNPTGHGGKYSTAIKKDQLANKCAALKTWKTAIKTDKSQYEHAADVVACLGHFMDHVGCK